jgi:hypothetical protein
VRRRNLFLGTGVATRVPNNKDFNAFQSDLHALGYIEDQKIMAFRRSYGALIRLYEGQRDFRPNPPVLGMTFFGEALQFHVETYRILQKWRMTDSIKP